MGQQAAPSYTDLVYEVLRSACRPLSFPEIFEAVNRRRAVSTRDPKATVRNALSQGSQLVSLGDGRYGYLPLLVQGSLIRLLLVAEQLGNRFLVLPEAVRHTLWPSLFESKRRSVTGPIHVRLPDGHEASLSLEFAGQGVWGCPVTDALARYLADNHARAGDSLLVRVLDVEGGRAQAWLEPRRQRNRAAIARRNREVADAAFDILRQRHTADLPIWDIMVALLARGAYRADVAPDPLEMVLGADPRFAYGGLSSWLLAEVAATPTAQAMIRERERLQAKLGEVTGGPVAGVAAAAASLLQTHSMSRRSTRGCGGCASRSSLVLDRRTVPRRVLPAYRSDYSSLTRTCLNLTAEWWFCSPM